MEEWKECKLTEIMDLIGGGTPKTSNPDYWDGDIPWISVKDFNGERRYVGDTEKKITKLGLENSSTKILSKGDIIISARGTVGELAIIPSDMAFNQSCYGLRAKDFVDSCFLYYLLKQSVNILKHNTHGSVFDTITRETFENISVKLPPLPTQQKIARILSSLDDKIELNNKINTNLEQQSRPLFKNCFVDFEPFSGKMPEEWKVGKLSDIADYLNGLAMQKFRPLEDEEGLPVLKIKELRQGCYDESSELCSPSKVRPEYIIHDGDVIFSWSGSLLVDIWCGGTCGLNQHLFKVTSQTYEKWFYYLWTKHHLDKFIFLAADKATTMGHIKREELDKAEVVIPDDKTYQNLTSVIKPFIDEIINNRIENRKLSQIRDGLLPKLMNGEIFI
ncbi:restriction endonuclease subunit S [uncultured Treponema sp.]|uniref:restriction endonuclease subunit S n=1 Tax=uncultured Treponema sp. TaxID=162155 RepID=UPI002596C579|nr:restriction endonuclease subunit S [uncultured Treponema sp.]